MNIEKEQAKMMEDHLRLQFNEMMFKMFKVMKRHMLVVNGQSFTAAEIHLIDTIGRHPNANVTDLARYQGITKSAVSQKIGKLESNGFVKRVQEPGNAKEVMLVLTPLGMKAYDLHDTFHKEKDEDLFEFLNTASFENMQFLIEGFQVINQVLDRYITDEKMIMDISMED
ncbi:MAG: MarR family transcriptional regulator [Clostridia bacterium]|nr:MarR family transcriptional regulator [Clostridia bacterium]